MQGQEKAAEEEMELIETESKPKKRLYDVVCNIITKYQDVFNLHRLARAIHLSKLKQLKEKERQAEKSFHSGVSVKQHSYKFFSSNLKHKTKSDNVSFNSKNSFKYFSNSQKHKTKSDSKLDNMILSGRRNSQMDGVVARGSLLADFNKFIQNENRKNEEKAKKSIENYNKRKGNKIEQVPVGVVNGRLMDFLSNELQEINDTEKKIMKNSSNEKGSFRFILLKI